MVVDLDMDRPRAGHETSQHGAFSMYTTASSFWLFSFLILPLPLHSFRPFTLYLLTRPRGTNMAQHSIRCAERSCQWAQQVAKAVDHLGRRPLEEVAALLRIATAAEEPLAARGGLLGDPQRRHRRLGAPTRREGAISPHEVLARLVRVRVRVRDLGFGSVSVSVSVLVSGSSSRSGSGARTPCAGST